MSFLTIGLLAACVALAIIPPRWDISILWREWQIGERSSPSFARGLKNAIVPSLLLWASVFFVIWMITN